MRLLLPNQAAAQGKATAIHNALLAQNSDYAASVARGNTVRWAVPYQDLDAIGGSPINSNWYVNCKTRMLGSLSGPDRAALLPFRT